MLRSKRPTSTVRGSRPVVKTAPRRRAPVHTIKSRQVHQAWRPKSDMPPEEDVQTLPHQQIVSTSRSANRNSELYRRTSQVVSRGYRRELLEIVEQHPNINDLLEFDKQDLYGSTMLGAACRKHYYGIVNILLAHGATPNAPTAQGPPIFHCVATMDLSLTRLLLSKGADPNSRNSQNQTILMLASTVSNQAFPLTIIEAGAHIDDVDSDGRTALMYAAKLGLPHTVACLRDRGATITLKDNKGLTAHDHAATRTDDQADVVQRLLSEKPSKRFNNRVFHFQSHRDSINVEDQPHISGDQIKMQTSETRRKMPLYAELPQQDVKVQDKPGDSPFA